MTLEEYAKQVADDLTAAYIAKDEDFAVAVFMAADEKLRTKKIKPDRVKNFWGLVEKKFSAARKFQPAGYIAEAQSVKKLKALLDKIDAQISARAG